MTPGDFLQAARVPARLKPQTFGLWTIQRLAAPEGLGVNMVGWPDYTLLWRLSWRSLHHPSGLGEIVMEDSQRELRKHLPIWMAAHGRVLVTGLGLGCVVRGLLASPSVEHIDVVEIDRDILRIVGHEFAGNRRVALHHGDATRAMFPRGTRWDFAWHDLWTDGDEHLQRVHSRLFIRYWKACGQQGAWAFPREIARLMPRRLLGAPRAATQGRRRA